MKSFITQQNMKQSNAADVFNIIRDSARITRREVASITGMSWAAVSTIVSRLLDEEYIIEAKCDSTGERGRTPSHLEVNDIRHFTVGLDINSSGFSAVVVNLKNEVLLSLSHPADFSSKDALMSGILSFVGEVLSHAKGKVRCIGIAMQGMVDSENGISLEIPHMGGEWKDVHIAAKIEDNFGIPTYIEHDPNCILYAAASDADADSLLVRIDDGIGMAAMVGGRILSKPGMFEIGHTAVCTDGGRVCRCGRRGCLELYASIGGMENLSALPFSQLVQNAQDGDAAALGCFSDMARRLAFSISNVARLLDIQNVILCGEMCKHRELFMPELERSMEYFDSRKKTSFSFTNVNLATLGAALIATDRSLKQIEI